MLLHLTTLCQWNLWGRCLALYYIRLSTHQRTMEVCCQYQRCMTELKYLFRATVKTFDRGLPILAQFRWSNRPINLPYTGCGFSNTLYILVENMGRINYGQYIFDKKGILSSVHIDGRPLLKWKMLSIPLGNLNESSLLKVVARHQLKNRGPLMEPAFYSGGFSIASDQISDTYISFRGWSKGIAFINDFNIGRFWPTFGPQCNLYVPAPILQAGVNTMILEMESPNSDLYVASVNQPDFTCGLTRSRTRRSEIGLSLA